MQISVKKMKNFNKTSRNNTNKERNNHKPKRRTHKKCYNKRKCLYNLLLDCLHLQNHLKNQEKSRYSIKDKKINLIINRLKNLLPSKHMKNLLKKISTNENC